MPGDIKRPTNLLLILIGAGAGIVLSLLFLMVFAGFIASGSIAESAETVCVLSAVFFGVFIGSFFVLRACSERFLLTGVAVGLCVFLLLLLTGVFFSFPPKGYAPLMLAVTLSAGLCGALPKILKKR